jgi:hypothetical protein
MGNKVAPPSEDEKKSQHGPYLTKMFDILKEQKSERVHEMYLGMRRIIQANAGNGIILEKEETKGVALGLVVGEKEHKPKNHWRSEYWAGNKNVRVYSVLKITTSPWHYYIFWDIATMKPSWIYTIQNVEASDAMLINMHGVLASWMIMQGDQFTIDHFKQLRADYPTYNEMNHVTTKWKELVEAKAGDQTLAYFEQLKKEKEEKEAEEAAKAFQKEEKMLAKKSKSQPNLAKSIKAEEKGKPLTKAKSEGKLGKK